MTAKRGIFVIGFIEIAIGATTLVALLLNSLQGFYTKPVNVFVFVLVSSCISVLLGIGLIARWHYCRKLLMFFAGWVILSKLLIFAGIISVSCYLETTISPDTKNIISIFYHLFIIFYLHQTSVKKELD